MLENRKSFHYYLGDNMKDVTIGNQQVTDGELGWLAGIYDGEGSFSLKPRKANMDFPEGGVNLSIEMVNTDTAIINKVDLILSKLKVSHYISERVHNIWKTRYDISVKKFSEAQRLLTIIKPFLVGKIGQAELLLRFIEKRIGLPKNTKYTQEDVQIVNEYREHFSRTREPQRLHAQHSGNISG